MFCLSVLIGSTDNLGHDMPLGHFHCVNLNQYLQETLIYIVQCAGYMILIYNENILIYINNILIVNTHK